MSASLTAVPDHSPVDWYLEVDTALSIIEVPLESSAISGACPRPAALCMEGLVYKGDLLSVEIADVMSWMLMRYTLGSPEYRSVS